MIKTSKHNISNIANHEKLTSLNGMFTDYKLCLEHYINLIIKSELPLKKNLSSKDLPEYNIKHSRYKQLIYKHASEIIRSQIKKANSKRYYHYKKIYSYFIANQRQIGFIKKRHNDLNLKNVVYSKYFRKPNINNISINLDKRFFDIQSGNEFDNFIKVILPYFNEKGTRALQLRIPLKQHKHSNKLLDKGYSLRNNIQLKQSNDKMYINLVWEKEDILIKSNGDTIGIDMGYKKLMVTSRGEYIGHEMFDLYQRISRKQQGSKNFNQLLTYRDNLINYHCNNLNVIDINKIVIEDLINVKHKSKLNNKINNKLQRWSYRKTIDKLERVCSEHGVELVKVSPTYTSQMCSGCGSIHKESRNGENYLCIDCGYEIDADLNASINIRNRGVYSVPDKIKDICL